MKIKILEKKPSKIKGYRIYEKVKTMRGKKEWHSWMVLVKERKSRLSVEKELISLRAEGTYRLARLRCDGSIQWLVEVAR